MKFLHLQTEKSQQTLIEMGNVLFFPQMPNASQFVSGHDIERDRLIYVYLSDEETANMTSWKTASRKDRNDKYQK